MSVWNPSAKGTTLTHVGIFVLKRVTVAFGIFHNTTDLLWSVKEDCIFNLGGMYTPLRVCCHLL